MEPHVAAPPAYAYAFQGSGLLVQQAVSSVAGFSLRTAPHVAATGTAALALTGFLSNLDDLVERLALSDGVALGTYGAGSDQGSVAAEALLQMFTRSSFNPLVLLSELQVTGASACLSPFILCLCFDARVVAAGYCADFGKAFCWSVALAKRRV